MSFFLYLLKVSLSLLLFFGLYRWVFSRLTFFRFNRFYLLGSLAVSVVLPLLRLPADGMIASSSELTLNIDWDAFFPGPVTEMNHDTTAQTFSPLIIVLSVYICVTAILLGYRIFRLMQAVSRYRTGEKLKEGRYRWVVHQDVETPFTMFRTIYMDPGSFRSKDPVITGHEKVHAEQLHTIDLLFIEMMIAFLWFNPVVFLFRRHMRENHEFLADRQALLKCKGLPEYMAAISAELTRRYDPAFASYFRSKTIKKRIIMLTNRKTDQKFRWVYLVSIPLLALLFMAFQQPAQVSMLNSNNRTVTGAGAETVTPAAHSSYSGYGDGIPSRFPLDEKYRNSITASHGKEFKNPFTGKLVVHHGVDIAAPSGSPVYATGDGVVLTVEQKKGYGKLIVIQHESGITTLYAHLDRFDVEEKDQVKRGEQIGAVGNTGYSTGPHLHYEVRKAGERLNPAAYY